MYTILQNTSEEKVIDDEFLKDHGISSWGNFNSCPEPYKESTAEDFWRQVYSHGFGTFHEFRQIHQDGVVKDSHIIAYYDKIFMIHIFYDGHEFVPRFFLVGCDHEYKVVDIGRCQNKHICMKCGFITIIDSSG